MTERKHAENGLDCWCEPLIAYEDDYSRVIVHHHWVQGEVRDGEDG
jgi:hypothetical protein